MEFNLDLIGWEIKNNFIEKSYNFKTFKHAIIFINNIADASDKFNHHPTIINTYDNVKIQWTTHSLNSITEKDINMAKICDSFYSSYK